jgi:hypothetical protein
VVYMEDLGKAIPSNTISKLIEVVVTSSPRRLLREVRITDHSAAVKIVRTAPQMYSIDDPTMVRAIYGISSPLPKSKWYDAWGDPRIPNHNLFSATDRAVHSVMR